VLIDEFDAIMYQGDVRNLSAFHEPWSIEGAETISTVSDQYQVYDIQPYEAQ